jgi:hypothetical protein
MKNQTKNTSSNTIRVNQTTNENSERVIRRRTEAKIDGIDLRNAKLKLNRGKKNDPRKEIIRKKVKENRFNIQLQSQKKKFCLFLIQFGYFWSLNSTNGNTIMFSDVLTVFDDTMNEIKNFQNYEILIIPIKLGTTLHEKYREPKKEFFDQLTDKEITKILIIPMNVDVNPKTIRDENSYSVSTRNWLIVDNKHIKALNGNICQDHSDYDDGKYNDDYEEEAEEFELVELNEKEKEILKQCKYMMSDFRDHDKNPKHPIRTRSIIPD